jgi:hypothetical protein
MAFSGLLAALSLAGSTAVWPVSVVENIGQSMGVVRA